MFIVITDHPLRVISRLCAQAANTASDYAEQVNTPSAHSTAAKICEAADYSVMQLIIAGLALPGDREAELQFIVNANSHREKIHEARLKAERGF